MYVVLNLYKAPYKKVIKFLIVEEGIIMAKIKSTSKKRDFITEISSMSDTELNDYIKAYGKPPKPIRLYHIINKEGGVNNEPKRNEIA